MQATLSPHVFSRRIGSLTKLLLLLLLLGAVLGGVLVLGTDRPEPIAMAPSALQEESLELAPQLGRATNDLVYRPLFWAGRRPSQEPEPVVVQEQTPVYRLDEVVLLGVFGSGGRSGVIVEVAGESRRLLLGEQLDGWTLETITEQRADFSRAGDDESAARESLELEHVRVAPVPADVRASSLNGRAGQDDNNNEAAGTDAGNQQQERNTNE